MVVLEKFDVVLQTHQLKICVTVQIHYVTVQDPFGLVEIPHSLFEISLTAVGFGVRHKHIYLQVTTSLVIGALYPDSTQNFEATIEITQVDLRKGQQLLRKCIIDVVLRHPFHKPYRHFITFSRLFVA